MSGDCSAKRPNKSFDSGATGFVLYGGKSREEHVGVLSADDRRCRIKHGAKHDMRTRTIVFGDNT